MLSNIELNPQEVKAEVWLLIQRVYNVGEERVKIPNYMISLDNLELKAQ